MSFSTIGMKKMKRLVVGNWKMNPLTTDEAKKIAQISKRTAGKASKTQVVLCPPFVYIPALSKLPAKNIFLGAQDAFFETMGHFTGEVSASQLYQFGVRYVLVGHSERRALGETNDITNRKLRAVLGEGMSPILCVGEKVRDTHGDYLDTIRLQTLEGLKDVQKKIIDRVVIAYEPVWAVGANKTPSTEEIHEISIFIKKILRDIYGVLSDGVRILYGGDVTVNNADRILADGFVHGLLIGRESLDTRDFPEIIRLVDSLK